MSVKATRPDLTIADDDLPPPRRRLPQTPPDSGDDAEVLARAETLAVRHKALNGRPTAPTPLATVQESWKITLPDYLNAELGRAAVERKVSKNFLVIEALMKAGYAVRPEDLVGDRRRRPKV